MVLRSFFPSHSGQPVLDLDIFAGGSGGILPSYSCKRLPKCLEIIFIVFQMFFNQSHSQITNDVFSIISFTYYDTIIQHLYNYCTNTSRV